MSLERRAWTEVSDTAEVAALLGVPRAAVTDTVRSVVRKLGLEAGYLREESAWQTPREPGVMCLEVAKTRLFINLTEAKKVADDLVIAAVVMIATQNLPLAALLAAARKIRETIRVLSEDETEVVRVIMGLAGGANAYEVGISEQDVRSAYKDAEVDINKLLDALQTKKILVTQRGGLVRLVY